MESTARIHAAVVIPVYNHGESASRMIAAVRAMALPCIVVDDGSEPRQASLLVAAAQAHGARLLRLPINGGKGAAVMAGLLLASELGHSHALQIDADGQHQPGDIPDFLLVARAHPQAVICGTPIYDATVPRGRLYGRYLTHVWVWIHTLSFAIQDSMCGFRVYPLPPVVALIRHERLGRRMDFDIDVLVRLHWRGVQIVNRPTRVIYPKGGVSHFDMLHDNLRISGLHTRLFFGMVRRLPALIGRKFTRRLA